MRILDKVWAADMPQVRDDRRTAAKKAVNLSIDASLLSEARYQGPVPVTARCTD
jgi:hypothetical protein